jgi:hypothetical protein
VPSCCIGWAILVSDVNERIQVGDCYAIPLRDKSFAYCQYVCWNKLLGFLVRVFDRVTKEVVPVKDLERAGELFPPVFVGLRASVKSNRWRRIGSLPLEAFTFPKFRCTAILKPGTYENWFLWDGEAEQFIGKLTPEQRGLELRVVWGDELLEDRIETGTNPYSGVL